MRIYFPNSGHLQNFGGFAKRQDFTDPSVLEFSMDPRYVSVHPLALTMAAAAGYPLYHRAVARLLRTEGSGSLLPWQRVIGAGGEIKLRFEAAEEQRLRLQMEGVEFRGRKVDLASSRHVFRGWELD